MSVSLLESPYLSTTDTVASAAEVYLLVVLEASGDQGDLSGFVLLRFPVEL